VTARHIGGLRIAALDTWMQAHDEAANEWLRTLLKTNREALLDLTGLTFANGVRETRPSSAHTSNRA